jgi:hypothetical protein
LKGEVAETGMVMRRGNYFRFGSVFIKKKLSNQKNNLKKITETGSNRPVSVRFGFFLQKPVQTSWLGFFGLARFLFWLGFFGLARFFVFGSVFPVWIGFCPVQLGVFSSFFRFGFGSIF